VFQPDRLQAVRCGTIAPAWIAEGASAGNAETVVRFAGIVLDFESPSAPPLQVAGKSPPETARKD